MIKHIYELINYGLEKKLIREEDRNYILNQLLIFFKLDYEAYNSDEKITTPEAAIFPLLDDMFERGLLENNSIQYKDLMLSKVMNIFASKPSLVIDKFRTLEKSSPVEATNWFYAYQQDLDYIKVERIKKNKQYPVMSKYGQIEITINLSKPEKDPKMIAKALNEPAVNYPKCVLCKENEGFGGNLKRDSRDTIRLIPYTLNNEIWYFQYSPYSYYNEHAIMLSSEHRPMVINRTTFSNLLELTNLIEGYFFGSNADLPIVGGSILNHDHYQGGKYNFSIERAKVIQTFKLEDIIVEVLNWPLSTIRLKSNNKEHLIDLSNKFLKNWIDYSNETEEVYSFTNQRHNTITPIARKKDTYEMDLVFRNNYTNASYPLGLYHPHEDVWPIKKENIGLIEVMGLAILPGRLIGQLDALNNALKGGDIPDGFEGFYNEIKANYDHKEDYVYKQAGLKFVKGLEDCKVLKDDLLIEFVKEVLYE